MLIQGFRFESTLALYLLNQHLFGWQWLFFKFDSEISHKLRTLRSSQPWRMMGCASTAHYWTFPSLRRHWRLLYSICPSSFLSLLGRASLTAIGLILEELINFLFEGHELRSKFLDRWSFGILRQIEGHGVGQLLLTNAGALSIMTICGLELQCCWR
jgi:hypothetical protein